MSQSQMLITHFIFLKPVLIVLCVWHGCSFNPPGEYKEVEPKHF